MKLKVTLDNFSPEAWEQTFGAFVKANKSHWRGAPYDAVMNQLRTKGRFEFAVTSMNTWTSKFVLCVLENGHLDVEFIPNRDLAPNMQPHLQKMKEQFELSISQDGLH